MIDFDTIQLDSMELVPTEWVDSLELCQYYVFNPSIIKRDKVYSLIYRVVDLKSKKRRVATCKLDESFNIIEGSVTPLSDFIKFADEENMDLRSRTWHADPRYFILKNEVYILWNDGAKKPTNNQFLLKMDSNGLRPDGLAKRVLIEKSESGIEKNWMLFEASGEVFAIYSYSPLKVLKLDFHDEKVVYCKEYSSHSWENEYEEIFGQIRGGSQPIFDRKDNSFLAVNHSSYKDFSGKLFYYPCLLWFHKELDSFVVKSYGLGPVTRDSAKESNFELQKLNSKVASVVYPCGSLLIEDDLIVSCGVNDEKSEIYRFSYKQLISFVNRIDLKNKSVKPTSVQVLEKNKDPFQKQKWFETTSSLPLFWWDSKGKMFDKGIGNRRFSVGNVGDIASKVVVEHYIGRGTKRAVKTDSKLLAIGSILQNARDGDIVWGSGVKGTIDNFLNEVNSLDVYAVRGPLTAEFLRKKKIDVSKIQAFFDPGVLLMDVYSDVIHKFNVNSNESDYCIVPHYRDDMYWRRRYPNLSSKMISVDTSPLDFIINISKFGKVVTSSLHAVIFAEMLGIPAVWLSPVHGEDEMKYYDYYYGTGRYQVKKVFDIPEGIRLEPMELPKFDIKKYSSTFPGNEYLEKFNPIYVEREFETDLNQLEGYESNVLARLGTTRMLYYFAKKEFLSGIKHLFTLITRQQILPILFGNESFREIFSFYFSIEKFDSGIEFRVDADCEEDFVFSFVVELLNSSSFSGKALQNLSVLVDQLKPSLRESKSSLIASLFYFVANETQLEKENLKSAFKNSTVFWKDVVFVYRCKRTRSQILELIDS